MISLTGAREFSTLLLLSICPLTPPLHGQPVIGDENWVERNTRIEKAILERATKSDWKRLSELRKRIIKSTAELTEEKMEDYLDPVPRAKGVKIEPGTRASSNRDAKRSSTSLDMVAIPGGSFLMGSPPDEVKRKEDEGPQVQVSISSFWMARYETSWNLYEPFVINPHPRKKDGRLAYPEHHKDVTEVDIVSSPTTPYTHMDFGMGRDGYPAINMTQHAANKFCEWLSFQTGHFYRLPTEAEWEYACRAGTRGRFSNPSELLSEYAVLDPDQVRVGYEQIGTKKPNPWKLYDMHGNVLEWCLDQYLPDAYGKVGSNPVSDPVHLPEWRYPRVIRGGSWYDPVEALHSARRDGSNENFKMQDPQLPKSIWHHTDAHFLGFRVIRPLEVPTLKEMYLYWNLGMPLKTVKGEE